MRSGGAGVHGAGHAWGCIQGCRGQGVGVQGCMELDSETQRTVLGVQGCIVGAGIQRCMGQGCRGIGLELRVQGDCGSGGAKVHGDGFGDGRTGYSCAEGRL